MTNYCTMAPDGMFGYYWGDVCKKHDIEYKRKKKKITRKEADTLLRWGIWANTPVWLFFIPLIYYYAVRLFSGPSWERWKYDWYLGFIPIRRRE